MRRRYLIAFLAGASAFACSLAGFTGDATFLVPVPGFMTLCLLLTVLRNDGGDLAETNGRVTRSRHVPKRKVNRHG
jgi:hypothetical protein